MTTEVKVKALKWKADHGVAGIGPYRLFEAFTPLGRFSYGTDSEGSPWWCAQYGGIFTVGDEETAKRQAEAAWSKAALAEVAKFIALEPSPSMREAVEALRKAIETYEAQCIAAGGYAPAVATLLRIIADEMADKYPDGTNAGRAPLGGNHG